MRCSTALGQRGGKIIERSFTLEEAKAAAEAFTTAATGLVTPVVEIDGVKLGDGKPGAVTRGVQKLYYTAIGADVAKAAPWVDGRVHERSEMHLRRQRIGDGGSRVVKAPY